MRTLIIILALKNSDITLHHTHMYERSGGFKKTHACKIRSSCDLSHLDAKRPFSYTPDIQKQLLVKCIKK